MRVHSLEMTAFGPFADTQSVDFEPLNTAGLFLLTGHTGAGKTSILDAICFGLFGQVPGDRDKAKTYRSQHAAPDIVPRVVLEVTLQGRRLRLTRRPPWSRPSRRARSGVVGETARASAEELVDGVWVALSTRVDEVGHLVTRLLGLDRDQFCQVVMLPQGDFQAFLRAGARERQHILETLFGTQRFQAVERWLAEHRRLQARRCRQQEERVATLVARLQEACSLTPGLQLDPGDLVADDPGLLQLARSLADDAAAELDVARERAVTTATSAKLAGHARDHAETVAERQERHREARRQHAALITMQDVVSVRETRLRRGRAAAPLQPLAVLAEDARLSYESAEALLATASEHGALTPGSDASSPTTAEAAGKLVAQLVQRLSHLEALTAIALECDELTERIAAEEDSRTAITTAADRLKVVLVETPGRVAELRTELDRVVGLLRRGADAADRREKALQAMAAARDAVALEAAAETLDSEIVVARDCAQRAAESWLDARERRLAGIAAELAGLLADGDPCPVCGSESHPSPALPASGQVSAAEEDELLQQVTTQRNELAALEQRKAELLSSRSDAIVRSVGHDVASAAAEVARAEADLRDARSGTREQAELTRALDAIEADSREQRSALDEAIAEVARADQRIAEWRGRLSRHLSELADEIGEGSSLAGVLAKTGEEVASARDLETAFRNRDEARKVLRAAQRRLLAALEPSEFDDATDLLSACLSQAEIAAEEAFARTHQVELASWARVLSDPLLVAAAAAPAPDLAELRACADEAAAAATQASGLTEAAERRQSRLESLLGELEGLLDELGPLRAARDLADDVAGLCAGTSTDNATRTALSHYVLGARLSQVVAAANHRLEAIGGGRYQLEHTMVRGAGDNRGGLGLVVRDTHTDQGRDPATLSGGETFYVSLSLALGLADVVTAEAGGSELSTLFVDEGFGSLDDDTRDEVLDELDALRSGGRSVGLVSHLSELRARCPAQLHVVATPRGSRCLPVRGV